MGSEAADHEEGQDAHPENVEAATRAAALRVALARYDATGSPAMLDQAFVAAAAAVASVRGARAREPANATELQELTQRLPEFGRLVAVAAAEGERWACAGADELWRWFGLRSEAAAWNEPERSAARLLVARACAPLDTDGLEGLRRRLLRVAAERWATLLIDELRAGGEEVWRRALGERYESVRGHSAPRTGRRSEGLCKLLDVEAYEPTVAAIRRRLARWLAQSRDLKRLPGELEAAFFETRTPARLA